MTIPGSLSAPGFDVLAAAEEALGVRRLPVVVHCAGRTRSIIAAQTLVDAGLGAPAMALENGTMGWTLAGLELDLGARRPAPAPGPESLARARAKARLLAERHGVARIGLKDLKKRIGAAKGASTLYVFDVRHPEEFAASRLEEPLGEANAPGGQLIQATDQHIGVFGAQVALIGDDGIRAEIAASWLRRLGWREVAVLESSEARFVETGPAGRPAAPPRPALSPPGPAPATIRPPEAWALIEGGLAAAVDFGSSRSFREERVPGSAWQTRAGGDWAKAGLPAAWRLVLTSEDGRAAALAARDLAGTPPWDKLLVLEGGLAAWKAAGLPLERGGEGVFLAKPEDGWYRPYLDPEASREAKLAYFEWEANLTAQLRAEPNGSFPLMEPGAQPAFF